MICVVAIINPNINRFTRKNDITLKVLRSDHLSKEPFTSFTPCLELVAAKNKCCLNKLVCLPASRSSCCFDVCMGLLHETAIVVIIYSYSFGGKISSNEMAMVISNGQCVEGN